MQERLKSVVLLQMKYKLSSKVAIQLGEKWLKAYPGQSWSTLTGFLKANQVEVINEEIVFMASPDPLKTKKSEQHQIEIVSSQGDSTENKPNVIVMMQMRYKISRDKAILMGETWLQENPGQTWTTLAEFIKSSQIKIQNDRLIFAGENYSQPNAISDNKAQGQSEKSSDEKQSFKRIYRGRSF